MRAGDNKDDGCNKAEVEGGEEGGFTSLSVSPVPLQDGSQRIIVASHNLGSLREASVKSVSIVVTMSSAPAFATVALRDSARFLQRSKAITSVTMSSNSKRGAGGESHNEREQFSEQRAKTKQVEVNLQPTHSRPCRLVLRASLFYCLEQHKRR